MNKPNTAAHPTFEEMLEGYMDKDLPLTILRRHVQDQEGIPLTEEAVDDYAWAIKREARIYRAALEKGPTHVRKVAELQAEVLRVAMENHAANKLRAASCDLAKKFDTLRMADLEILAKLFPADVQLFVRKCRTHDWYYSYSDDINMWRAGEARFREIMAEIKEDTTGTKQKIFDLVKPK